MILADKRHFGRFRVSEELVMNSTDDVSRALRGVVVVEAQWNFRGYLDFVGYSPAHFRTIGEGAEPPEYQLLINTTDGELVASWRELTG